jgi:hypothetical protein
MDSQNYHQPTKNGVPDILQKKTFESMAGKSLVQVSMIGTREKGLVYGQKRFIAKGFYAWKWIAGGIRFCTSIQVM